VLTLVAISLTLVTVSFRESSDGPLHGFQSDLASVLRPFEVAAERVARPFRDAAGWVGGLSDANEENERLREEVDRLRQQLIQGQTALRENRELRALLRFQDSARFPRDFRGLATRVIARAPTQFEQRIVVAVGSNSGVRVHDPVVTRDGLVGQVTKVFMDVSEVTLLTDETSAVTARDLRTAAVGILRHGSSSGSSLVLDLVKKNEVVESGDVIITAGWRAGDLSSIYPRGLPIGVVTNVSQRDTDLYKRVEVEPFVDFGSLDSVLVLVGTGTREAG
jgi:rod shape-determining protein MreC